VYSASLAQASAQGIMLSVLIVAVGLGVYFILSRRAEILGASVLMLILSLATENYYHIVYAAGAMLGLALLMQVTDFDEGTLRGSLFYAGAGSFIALMLYYLMPTTISASLNSKFIILVGIAAFFVLIEGVRTGFEYDIEAAIAVVAAFAIAFILLNMIGITHLNWGVALMMFGVILEAISSGFLAVTSFVAGLIVWLDDVVGYTTYNQNQGALSLLLPIGVILIVIFAYLQWRD